MDARLSRSKIFTKKTQEIDFSCWSTHTYPFCFVLPFDTKSKGRFGKCRPESRKSSRMNQVLWAQQHQCVLLSACPFSAGRERKVCGLCILLGWALSTFYLQHLPTIHFMTNLNELCISASAQSKWPHFVQQWFAFFRKLPKKPSAP